MTTIPLQPQLVHEGQLVKMILTSQSWAGTLEENAGLKMISQVYYKQCENVHKK